LKMVDGSTWPNPWPWANTPASWPSVGAGLLAVADGCGVAGVAGAVAAAAVAAGVLAGTLDGAAAGLLDALLALAAGCDGLAEQPVITAAATAATAMRVARLAWAARVAASFMSCSLSRARARTHL
jgi:hypothetical protein